MFGISFRKTKKYVWNLHCIGTRVSFVPGYPMMDSFWAGTRAMHYIRYPWPDRQTSGSPVSIHSITDGIMPCIATRHPNALRLRKSSLGLVGLITVCIFWWNWRWWRWGGGQPVPSVQTWEFVSIVGRDVFTTTTNHSSWQTLDKCYICLVAATPCCIKYKKH